MFDHIWVVIKIPIVFDDLQNSSSFPHTFRFRLHFDTWATPFSPHNPALQHVSLTRIRHFDTSLLHVTDFRRDASVEKCRISVLVCLKGKIFFKWRVEVTDFNRWFVFKWRSYEAKKEFLLCGSDPLKLRVCRSEEYSHKRNKKFRKIQIPGSFAPFETIHMSISPGFVIPVSHFMSVRLKKSDSSHRSVCIEFPRRSFLIFLPLIAILEC